MKNKQTPSPIRQPNHDRAISLRAPDDTLHALSQYTRELASRDRQPYTRSAVLLSLVESQLHQHKKLKRQPLLKKPGTRRTSPKQMAKKSSTRQQPITQLPGRENKLPEN
jgi:hypothetical protein